MRRPDDTIGHSVLIYRLTAAEIAAATTDTLEAWRTAVERAADR